MFISPKSAQWWNQTLATDRGEAIVKMLAPFCEMPLALAPPVKDLDARIRAAILDLGLPRTTAAPLSIGDVRACIERMPDAMRQTARKGIAGAMMFGQIATLDDVLERTVGGGLSMRTFPTADVSHPLTDSIDRDLRELVTTGLRLSLSSTLRYHVLAIADGRGDLAAKVEPFTKLFREGNYPMGPLRDGTCLVLVA
jgi:hypothetical protein